MLISLDLLLFYQFGLFDYKKRFFSVRSMFYIGNKAIK